MKTAIIIATYRRPALVERALRNLAECELPPDVEIHILENGPACGVDEICRRITIGGRVRYAYSPVANKVLALNRAIRESKAEFLIFFDDDVTVPKDIVTTYVDAARRYGAGHFFGGPLMIDAEIACPPHLVPHLPRSAIGWSLGSRETEIEARCFEFFFGANWAAFQPDLMAVGLFAENLGVTGEKYSPVGEETELQHRLIKTGAKAIYLPGAFVHHLVQRECYTMAWVWRRSFRLGLTDWIVSHRAVPKRRHFLGVPLWIIRKAMEQRIKALVSHLSSMPIERKTAIRIRNAYLAGMLRGAWIERKHI